VRGNLQSEAEVETKAAEFKAAFFEYIEGSYFRQELLRVLDTPEWKENVFQAVIAMKKEDG
jgi:hypothetical protein